MGEVVLLSKTPIDLNSDVGHAFIVDATRAAEGLISGPGACGEVRAIPRGLAKHHQGHGGAKL
jgi:hypothetical protein